MTIYDWFILAPWLALVVYWAIVALDAKRSIGGQWRWRREIGLRLTILALVVLLAHLMAHNHPMRAARLYAFNRNIFAGWVGATLCAFGVAVAIWARACLGRNWGMPMTQKAHPELVTNGPYAYVRHPIYTGIILALLGSAIGLSVLWAIPLLLIGGYFAYSASREEQLLLERFPEEYSAYARRSKRLIPFLW
jgi:protein-S-isoprenylcysteine O-methyltransferase Ste14